MKIFRIYFAPPCTSHNLCNDTSSLKYAIWCCFIKTTTRQVLVYIQTSFPRV
ncbi:hypothetical protein BDZ94DRAFT_1272953 [Collybia nuda]|uniref:Uncharacterized protein n=1 Tax=Collybia nuda TaxID=64659 RepID=A0A9P5XXK3_9AGAR|nr:hypothetical protein BDZ94DRAFT_1272953 [Collybia nuda]